MLSINVYFSPNIFSISLIWRLKIQSIEVILDRILLQLGIHERNILKNKDRKERHKTERMRGVKSRQIKSACVSMVCGIKLISLEWPSFNRGRSRIGINKQSRIVNSRIGPGQHTL